MLVALSLPCQSQMADMFSKDKNINTMNIKRLAEKILPFEIEYSIVY